MSRNGSGVYQPSATGYPAVASTTIESAKYNAVIADIATALTLSIAANGETTITANIPLAGYKITGLGNASADTDALNRVTGDGRYATLTGATFTGAVTISAAVPYLLLSETGVTADNGKWAMLATGEGFSIRAYTDDMGTVSQPMLVTRTATTVDSITFAGTTVALTGNATVSGTLGVTGDVAVNTNKFTVAASSGNVLVAGTLTVGAIDATPTTGSFTINLRATVGGANLASGTAYWHKMNGVVTLFIPALSVVSTDANLYVEDLPAAIQTSRTQKIPCVGYLNGPQDFVLATVQGGNDYIRISPPDGGSFAGGSSERGVNGTTIVYQVA